MVQVMSRCAVCQRVHAPHCPPGPAQHAAVTGDQPKPVAPVTDAAQNAPVTDKPAGKTNAQRQAKHRETHREAVRAADKQRKRAARANAKGK